MKVNIKNLVGAVALLLVGFLLGRVTILSGVSASPQESQVGRYQLIVGEIDLGISFFNEEGSLDTAWTLTSGPTLFRIDTKTGDVDYRLEEMCFMRDTVTIWEHRWEALTGVELVELIRNK